MVKVKGYKMNVDGNFVKVYQRGFGVGTDIGKRLKGSQCRFVGKQCRRKETG